MMLLLFILACRSERPVVVSAAELGLVEGRHTIEGRDGGSSGMAGGRSVWTYGDTVLKLPDIDGTNWHPNSDAITDDLDASEGQDPYDAVAHAELAEGRVQYITGSRSSGEGWFRTEFPLLRVERDGWARFRRCDLGAFIGTSFGACIGRLDSEMKADRALW